METPIHFMFVGLAFCSFVLAVIVFKRKRLFILFLSLGLLLLAFPFVNTYRLTRDAYPWTIIVNRNVNDANDPIVIFVSEIEWITDYEKIKRWRGKVRSFMLKEDITRKEFHVKGYIPLLIRAKFVHGPDERTVTRSLKAMDAGSYTFTLTFDESDRASWAVKPSK